MKKMLRKFLEIGAFTPSFFDFHCILCYLYTFEFSLKTSFSEITQAKMSIISILIHIWYIYLLGITQSNNQCTLYFVQIILLDQYSSVYFLSHQMFLYLFHRFLYFAERIKIRSRRAVHRKVLIEAWHDGFHWR